MYTDINIFFVYDSKQISTFLQLDNPPKIPPKDWVCSKCSLTANLWMNLTDGTISCGRRFFDGSGGNNHAIEHYNETKYPLVIITFKFFFIGNIFFASN
jgi:ubiquitin carboxyl-terminal hydrolase 5/13